MSIGLSAGFYKEAKVGEKILMEVFLEKKKGNIFGYKIHLKDLSGKIIVSGKHTKMIVDASGGSHQLLTNHSYPFTNPKL